VFFLALVRLLLMAADKLQVAADTLPAQGPRPKHRPMQLLRRQFGMPIVTVLAVIGLASTATAALNTGGVRVAWSESAAVDYARSLDRTACDMGTASTERRAIVHVSEDRYALEIMLPRGMSSPAPYQNQVSSGLVAIIPSAIRCPESNTTGIAVDAIRRVIENPTIEGTLDPPRACGYRLASLIL
jgi:hypothetical protein